MVVCTGPPVNNLSLMEQVEPITADRLNENEADETRKSLDKDDPSVTGPAEEIPKSERRSPSALKWLPKTTEPLVEQMEPNTLGPLTD